MNDLVQGSAEWLAYRQGRFNASEAGAVMSCNPWFPRSPAELFDLKSGARDVVVNAAMSRGTELEPVARDALESVTGIQFTPVVKERGRYSASLDGEDFDGVYACEIKVPRSLDSKLFKCKSPEDLKKAAPHYWWQMVHQRYVAGFKKIWFFAWHPDNQIAISIPAELLDADRDALIEAWESFGKALDANERPEPPVIERSDDEWLAAVNAYTEAKQAAKAAAAAEKDAKDLLIEIAGKKPTRGYGVQVIQIERAGSVDYSKIPELDGVDLERYRKKPTKYWSVK